MKLFSKLFLAVSLLVLSGLSWAKPMALTDNVATQAQAIEAIKGFHGEHAKAKQAIEKLWQGSGTNDEIWAAMEAEARLVLKHAVVVESYYSKTAMSAVQKEAQRDALGIMNNIRLEAGKLGWAGGGTSANDSMLEAERDHYLTRLVYYAVRVHDQRDDPQFDLTQFLAVLELEIPLV